MGSCKMKTFMYSGVLYEVPDIRPILETVLEIKEGPYEGVWFTLHDMQMDEEDECLMHYEVEASGATVDEIKPIVDNFIIMLLHDQMERATNAASTTIDQDS